jgi:protein CMS1
MIFIVSAALRAADAARILKSFVQPSPKSTNKGKKDDAKKGTAEKSEISKAGEVAKLFGKHFKLAEHKAYLEKTKVGSGVGTPGRVAKLLEGSSISPFTVV